MNHPASIPCKPVQRLADFFGVACGCTLLAAIVTLFGSASQMDWLLPSAAHQAALAPCDAVHGTRARQRCVEAAVASVKAEARGLRWAGADAPTVGLQAAR